MSNPGRMVSFAADGERFTLRVAGVCLLHGHVLLHRAVEETFWVLPGGRVHHGEATADAIARELREEIPVPTTVERLLWVAENFFVFLGERFHEIGFYYLYSLPSDSPWCRTDRDLAGREGEIDLVFRWFPVRAVADAPLYPAFLRHRLAQDLPPGIEAVVERDDETTSAAPGPV